MRRPVFFVLKLNWLLFILGLVAVILFALTLHFSGRLTGVFGPLKGKVVVIDPGHGGTDGGANSPGLLEKDINLAIANKLKKELEASGIRVVLTRNQDINLDKLYTPTISRQRKDLLDRIDIIQKTKPDLFLSIHVNSNPRRPSTNGPMVFYSRRVPGSSELAESMQKHLNLVADKNG